MHVCVREGGSARGDVVKLYLLPIPTATPTPSILSPRVLLSHALLTPLPLYPRCTRCA